MGQGLDPTSLRVGPTLIKATQGENVVNFAIACGTVSFFKDGLILELASEVPNYSASFMVCNVHVRNSVRRCAPLFQAYARLYS